MKDFVKLTTGAGNPVFYRKDGIQIVRYCKGMFSGAVQGSYILTSDGGERFVQETPAQVMELMEQSKE